MSTGNYDRTTISPALMGYVKNVRFGEPTKREFPKAFPVWMRKTCKSCKFFGTKDCPSKSMLFARMYPRPKSRACEKWEDN